MRKLFTALIALAMIVLTGCAPGTIVHYDDDTTTYYHKTTIAEELYTNYAETETTQSTTTTQGQHAITTVAPARGLPPSAHPYPSPFDWATHEEMMQREPGLPRMSAVIYTMDDLSQHWAFDETAPPRTWSEHGMGSVELRRDISHLDFHPITNRDEAAHLATAIFENEGEWIGWWHRSVLRHVVHDPANHRWIMAGMPTSAEDGFVLGYSLNLAIDGSTGELLHTWLQ